MRAQPTGWHSTQSNLNPAASMIRILRNIIFIPIKTICMKRQTWNYRIKDFRSLWSLLCLKSNIISVAELNVGLFALAHAIIWLIIKTNICNTPQKSPYCNPHRNPVGKNSISFIFQMRKFRLRDKTTCSTSQGPEMEFKHCSINSWHLILVALN